jgi:hypothetical protein
MMRIWIGAAFAAFVAVSSVCAQQQTMRVRGTVERLDGATLVIKTPDGEVKVNLTENAGVFGVIKGSLADVKPGAFIGVGAMPQPDGSQRAIQVTVFAEVQRGTGEGHRPWDRQPNSTMTNATVDTTVAGVDGQVVTVKYRDGEKKIVVPPEASILRYEVSNRSELKPGAAIAIIRAVKKPDGTLETDRINVGRGGVVPQ